MRVTWTKVTDHRRDWLECWTGEVVVFGEPLHVGHVYVDAARNLWGYHLSGVNGEVVAFNTMLDATRKVEAWWREQVGVKATLAPAEVRAAFYKKQLMSLIGSGDRNGYQDMWVVESLLEMGDVEGVKRSRLNLTHMPAHDQTRLALALGEPVT